MKANILQRFTNIFQKQMDYESWWFEPLKVFQKEYQEKGGSFFEEKYITELHSFERELRSRNDVLGRFYTFMDENYTVHINATPNERAEIRLLVGKQGKINRHFEDLVMKYVKEWVIQQLRATGKSIWLTRGLVGISIENSGVDYRDTLTSMAELYTAAEEKGINPKNDFQKISNISSDEIPTGGTTSTKKLMAGIHSSAMLREQKSKRN